MPILGRVEREWNHHQMSHEENTAVNPPSRSNHVVRVMAIGISVVAFASIIGHAIEYPNLTHWMGKFGMSINSALCFLMVGFSLILISKDER